ncbi:hypothetical protein, partial [Citrobacter rodentium]|uniref:hypothetical protein n=1 Tax=Citrobacter rodentium TaxID=67825 RepID=UPI000695FFE6
MANLPEPPQWEDGIYQIEVSDPVLGGPDGITNRPAKQLASRTLYLKQQVEQGVSDLADHIAADDPHTQYAPKESPTFTGTPTAPTPASSDNSKKLATTEFVARIISALTETVSGKLSQEQNGADIPDPEAFVKNLGLGEAAKRDIGTGANQIPDMSAFASGGSSNARYTKLPDGTVIQRGNASVPYGGATITLPTAFP